MIINGSCSIDKFEKKSPITLGFLKPISAWCMSWDDPPSTGTKNDGKIHHFLWVSPL